MEFFGRLPAELAEHVIKAVEANLAEINLCETEASMAESNLCENEANIAETNLCEASEIVGDNLTSDESVNTASGIVQTLRKNVPAEPSGETVERKPSLAMRRADALVALCSANCEGYEVTLHVPAGDSPRANALGECGTIPIETARRICCDAAVVPVTEDDEGNVLDIGRRTRKVPPAMRRALEIRDKACCRFPGCTHTRFLHAHHIKHWASGGTTSLNNLVLLCWHHHHLVHEGGFDCRNVKRQGKRSRQLLSIVFVRPDGVMIPDGFRLPATQGSIEEKNNNKSINETTCTARDHSTRLDVGMVIDELDFIRRQDSIEEE